MSNEALRRVWMAAPVTGGAVQTPGAVELRCTSPADDAGLAALFDDAYADTIDFDPDHDHVDELGEWRRIDGADDATSTVAVLEGSSDLVGACLIGWELGEPIVYEIAVRSRWKGQGLSRAVLSRSMSLLAESGFVGAARAWVTVGNEESEALLARAGFVAVTPPLDESTAGRMHRGALLARKLEAAEGVVASGVLLPPDSGPVAVIVGGEPFEPGALEVHGVTVTTLWVDAADEDAVARLTTATPVTGCAWLLARRAAPGLR